MYVHVQLAQYVVLTWVVRQFILISLHLKLVVTSAAAYAIHHQSSSGDDHKKCSRPLTLSILWRERRGAVDDRSQISGSKVLFQFTAFNNSHYSSTVSLTDILMLGWQLQVCWSFHSLLTLFTTEIKRREPHAFGNEVIQLENRFRKRVPRISEPPSSKIISPFIINRLSLLSFWQKLTLMPSSRQILEGFYASFKNSYWFQTVSLVRHLLFSRENPDCSFGCLFSRAQKCLRRELWKRDKEW